MFSLKSKIPLKIKLLLLFILFLNIANTAFITNLNLQVYWTFAILIGVFILSIVIVHLFINSQIVKPLQSINEALEAMLKGNLRGSITIDSKDEFSIIGEKLSELGDKLQSNIETLRETEETHRAIMDTTVEGIILFNAQKTILFVNKAATEILGFSKGNLLGKSFNDFLEDDIDLHMDVSFQGVQRLDPIIKTIKKHDQSKLALEISISRFELIGNPTFTAVFKPLEKSRLALKKLIIRERDFIRELIQRIHIGIVVVRRDGRIILTNSAIEDILGYKTSELTKNDFFTKAFPDFHVRNQNFEHLKRIKEGYNLKELEIHASSKDGKLKILLVSTSRYKDGGEIIVLVQDVTERKKLEQNLLQVQKMEGIGTLAAGLAHDFNNLLTGILGYSNLLKMGIDGKLPGRGKEYSFPKEKLYKYLESIENAAQRASKITRQMLSISRKSIFQPQPLSLNQLVDEVELLLKRILNKKVTLETKRTTKATTIEADPSQVIQVLMNLCINAQDAMPNGGKLLIKTGVIRIEKGNKEFPDKKPGSYVFASVEDTGTGIEPALLKTIWDPFFTTKEMGKGTGLGLSMVDSILRKHNGFVKVESTIGKGSCFYIYFPESVAFIYEKKEEDEKITAGHETILIIDDDEIALSFTQNILEDVGYKTHSAINGSDGIDTYEKYKNEINLVILDMVLPKKSATEVFKELKKINPEVKVLLYSGYVQYTVAESLIKLGALGFLQKPFRIVDLLHKVRGILDNDSKK